MSRFQLAWLATPLLFFTTLPLAAAEPDAPVRADWNGADWNGADWNGADWNGREWREAVRDALREQATAAEGEKEAATRTLLDLYRALPSAQLGPRDQRVLHAKLHARLERARQELLEARVAKEAAAEEIVAEGEQRLGENPILGQFGNFPANRAPNARDDHGEELVDLIQKVISPDSWDVNGGNGTIVYWQGQRVLVVRNTREVHAQLQDLGDALRKVAQ